LDMVRTLSQMYTQVFGQWVFYLFVIGAFVVLYSTYFVAMATWARLTADTCRLLSPEKDRFDLRRATRVTLVVLAVAYFLLCIYFSQAPQWLIVMGAMVQTLTLPIFALAIILIRKTRQDPFRPGRWFDVLLYFSWVIIAAAAIYSVINIKKV
jgi:manganese transport protein